MTLLFEIASIASRHQLLLIENLRRFMRCLSVCLSVCLVVITNDKKGKLYTKLQMKKREKILIQNHKRKNRKS